MRRLEPVKAPDFVRIQFTQRGSSCAGVRLSGQCSVAHPVWVPSTSQPPGARATTTSSWRRSAINDVFGTPKVVTDLNTTDNFEFATSISQDNCRIYFMRDYHIFFAERSPTP
jgi:hypothetical protein